MAIPKDTLVRQIVPAPVQGVVKDYAVDRESGATQVLVAWTDADGDHERFFREEDVEVITG